MTWPMSRFQARHPAPLLHALRASGVNVASSGKRYGPGAAAWDHETRTDVIVTPAPVPLWGVVRVTILERQSDGAATISQLPRSWPAMLYYCNRGGFYTTWQMRG